MIAKKDADINALTSELRDLSEKKSKDILDLTSSHTMHMTQLQSGLMADIDIYYTKSKCLEEEVGRKQCVIQVLKEKIYDLEENFHQQCTAVADKEKIYSAVTDTEGSIFTSCSEPASPAIHRQCNDIPPSPSSMCDGLTLTSVQLWNENLRTELQRVHSDLDQETTRSRELSDALVQSETEREVVEKFNNELQNQVQVLVNSKEQVLATVQRVQTENIELKNTLRRIKHL